MAARKRNWQTNKTKEKIRDSIKTGLIVKRFEDHVLKSEQDEGYVKLTQTQIKAGEVLLSRTLPTLSSSEIVETNPEKGIDQSMQQLESILGKDLAKALTTKEGMKALAELIKLQEKPQTHEEPAQAQ